MEDGAHRPGRLFEPVPATYVPAHWALRAAHAWRVRAGVAIARLPVRLAEVACVAGEALSHVKCRPAAAPWWFPAAAVSAVLVIAWAAVGDTII